MKKIGGNITGIFQIKVSSGKNSIGENIESWEGVIEKEGFLDYSAGENGVNQYNAKIQDTTHYFLCDYDPLEVSVDGSTIKITAENCRMMIDDEIYDVLLIDDPMKLHQHLEIYLKYVGGGLGV